MCDGRVRARNLSKINARDGSGIGRRLYERLFAALATEDVHRAYAGITLPNPGSVALHERLGFTQIGVFTHAGRKFGRYWDVAWYEKHLETESMAREESER